MLHDAAGVGERGEAVRAVSCQVRSWRKSAIDCYDYLFDLRRSVRSPTKRMKLEVS